MCPGGTDGSVWFLTIDVNKLDVKKEEIWALKIFWGSVQVSSSFSKVPMAFRFKIITKILKIA